MKPSEWLPRCPKCGSPDVSASFVPVPSFCPSYYACSAHCNTCGHVFLDDDNTRRKAPRITSAEAV